jgi:hypothetical protein
MEREREALNHPKEGTMRKLIILLAALTLVAPLMFYGCSGDDGDRGPAGATGATGEAGGPGTGIVADETCVLCHGAGKTENVTDVHRIGQTAGSMTVEIQSVEFGAVTPDNNVPVTVNFTFAAENSAGDNITSLIDLRTPAANTTALPNNSADNLAYIRFSLAQLTPGQNGSPNEWGGFEVSPGATGSGPFSTANRDGINGAAFAYTTPVRRLHLPRQRHRDSRIQRQRGRAGVHPGFRRADHPLHVRPVLQCGEPEKAGGERRL